MTDEARVQADIEALRPKFPDTQDLYREVCTVLFFRYGITPTANKLYQLVRKGSMSAPAEALAKFWDTLREKSRVRIEHPDVPEALRDIAGELTANIWLQARSMAEEANAALRLDVQQQVEVAQQAEAVARQREDNARQAAVALESTVAGHLEQIRTLEQRLALDEGLRFGLAQQVEQLTEQRRELTLIVDGAKEAEKRAADEHKRLLLEIDRERGQAARVQKELDALRSRHDRAHKAQEAAAAKATQQSDQLRQSIGELEVSLAATRRERDQLQNRLALEESSTRSSVRRRGVLANKGVIRHRVK
ncbi:MAG: DNA-binding protein [Burkholderiales bacterium]|jgi:hypothetical protein|nr:MAG: DNA-binding protein [Burkholderiales bacterium]